MVPGGMYMSKERLAGLDMWRACLPLVGVVYHAFGRAADHYGAPLLFNWAGVATHAFRMEAFFALAGLLAGSRLMREGYATVRTRTLLVPFAALYLICAIAKGVEFRSLLTGSTTHLWFLLSLTTVTLAAIVAERAGLIRAMLASWERTALVLVAWAFLAKMAGFGDGGNIFSVSASIGPLAFYFAPFFLGGVLVARSEKAKVAAYRCRGAWKLGCVGSILLVARSAIDGDLLFHETAAGELLLVTTAFLWAVGVLGTATGRGGRPAGPVARWMGEAGYTVYILHYPALLTMEKATVGMPWAVRLVLGLAASGIVPLAAHAASERLPLLRFLLNGTIETSGNGVLWRRART